MKKNTTLIIAGLCLALSACAMDETDATVGLGKADQAEPAACAANTYVFARDLRPVDGTLEELRLTKDGEGKYDAVLRTAGPSRGQGPTNELEIVALAMDCDFSDGVWCEADNPRLQGVTQLEVTVDEDGEYTATRITRSMIAGQMFEGRVEIAGGLSERVSYVFSIPRADWVRAEVMQVRITENASGTFETTTRTAPDDGLPVGTISSVADHLECSFEGIMFCSDETDEPRPGPTTVVTIETTAEGLFDATWSFFGVVAGGFFENTIVLGSGLSADHSCEMEE